MLTREHTISDDVLINASENLVDMSNRLSDMLVSPRCVVRAVIKGQPPSKARPRFNGKGFCYSSSKQRAAEKHLKEILGRFVIEPYTGMMAVGATFYRDSAHRVDVDNMVKHVFDSANKVVFVDDAQVTCLVATVKVDRENPRTELVIYEHDSDHRVPGITEKRTCERCGVVFKYRALKTRIDRRFCSRKCIKVPGEIGKCATCSCEFVKAQRDTYCSNECRLVALHQSNRVREPGKCACGATLSRNGITRCRKCYLSRSGVG